MKTPNLKSLKAKAWKLMSEWIRSRDADWRGYAACFTCGTVKPWKELDCGHYIHNKLDLDERNLRPQCVRCNNYLSGNLGSYAERLVKENGLAWLEELRRDSNQKGNNYTIAELEAIIEDLKLKLRT